jgi:peptide/nickel transport system substrate-binding protein
MTEPRRHAWRRVAALSAAVALLATSCSLFGDDDEPQAVATGGVGPAAEESGLTDAEPQRGGQLVYGLEAETTGGFCLPEAQIAISGMQVVRSVYDFLAVPDAKGGYAPYLAKAITPDKNFRVWTITLRNGITFHDGTPLDATVVKNNLDAYRGAYPARTPLLFSFVLKNIASVVAVNELTVRVTTKTPWSAFPAVLYSSGRLGIVGQSQLDADTDSCERQLVGTGPFEFVSWTPNVSLNVKRYPDYWQEAPDGKPYPYVSAVEFRPIPSSDARLAALQRGEVNILHTSTASDMAENLPRLRDDGAINLLVSSEQTEVSYLLLNSSHAPLDDRAARLAIAQAIDRKKLNDEANAGFPALADGPFAPGVMGHVAKPGFPAHDLPAARRAVKALKADGADTKLDLLTTTDPPATRAAVIEKEMLEAAGFTVKLVTVAQADLISKVLAGEYDIATFRNQPGDDPDSDYHWWYGAGNPVNFGRFDDPVINVQLDKGRASGVQEDRKAAYEAINREFAKQVWNVWLWHAPWAVAESANVHGILGPDLPDGQGRPPARIVTGHSLLGVWIDRSQ